MVQIISGTGARGRARLFKEGAARAYLGGMSHGALWDLRQSGVIPTLRVNKSIYFDREDLDRFIDDLHEKAAK